MKSIYTKSLTLFASLFFSILLTHTAFAAPFSVAAPVPNPSTVFVNQSILFHSDIADGPTTTIDHCKLSIDGVDKGAMTIYPGTTFLDTTIPSSGTHVVRTTCYDVLETTSAYHEAIVTVFPDSQAPALRYFTVNPTSPLAGSSVDIQVDYDDTEFGSGVDSCKLYIDDGFITNMGLSTGSGHTLGTASTNHAMSVAGDHVLRIDCTDLSGNVGTASQTITVTTPPPVDTTPPTVGIVEQASATAGTPLTHTGSLTNSSDISNCSLYVNGSSVGGTTVASDHLSQSISYTYTGAGNYNVYFKCTDTSGNVGNGPVRTITVTAPGTITSPYALRLVKLICPAGVIGVNDPCKAVYYVGADGKRHAFPNERIYFTWYTNFDSVVEVNSAELSSMPLGPNVQYRPGVRMVKFTTLNKVYAVGRYGTLRWVTSESVATSLYGSNWNTKIDDISDAFFGDYTFGTDITSVGSYSPSSEMSVASTIEANLR